MYVQSISVNYYPSCKHELQIEAASGMLWAHTVIIDFLAEFQLPDMVVSRFQSYPWGNSTLWRNVEFSK